MRLIVFSVKNSSENTLTPSAKKVKLLIALPAKYAFGVK